MNVVNRPPTPGKPPALRGAEAQRLGGRFWLVTGALLLLAFATVVGVSFASAANDNARIGRLKSQGTPVVVTVTDCVGNIGGSGSNVAGYTCHGEYRVRGVRYREVIASKSTDSSPGSTVQGIVDPAHPSTVELASAVATSKPSSTVYVVPSILGTIWVALSLALLHRHRAPVRRESRLVRSSQ